MIKPKTIYGQAFHYNEWLISRLRKLDKDINDRWEDGRFLRRFKRNSMNTTN